MGIGGRFFVRNVCAAGAALGLALLLLAAYNSFTPWLIGNTGSVLAVQRAWSEMSYLAENEGVTELLRPQTQEALTSICRTADSEWLLLSLGSDANSEMHIVYQSFLLELNDLPTIRQAATTNQLYRRGWRNLQVQKLSLRDGRENYELLFLAAPTELLNLERDVLVVGLGLFTLCFLAANIWLSRWLRASITDPLVLLKQTALELTRGEELPEIPTLGEGEVAELAVSLEQLRLRIKESVRLRERADQERAFMISSISHDLKTPLTAIRGYVEAVQLPNLPEERRNYYLSNAEHKVDQLSFMIDDLLLFSKFEQNGAVMNFTLVQARQIFQEILREQIAIFEFNGVQLVQSDQLDELTYLKLDSDRFKRVLQNILDNARNYAAQPQGIVEIILRQSRGEVLIEVTDNGAGLKPGDQERIFERFYRGDSARNQQGSGLGLAIARQIVTAHGGHIWAKKPEVGKGCTIIISLPIVVADF